MKTKICSRCKEKLSLNKFYRNRSTRDGLSWWCKECNKEYDKKHRENNPEKVREYQKRFRENNPEYHKEYYQKNKEKLREKARNWISRNSHRFWAMSTLNKHKSNGYKINIKINELEQLAKQTTNCPICETKLNWKTGNKKKKQINSPTLDRINNEKVLNRNNIWIICNKCNTSKYDRTFDEFIEYCTKVSNKFKKGE